MRSVVLVLLALNTITRSHDIPSCSWVNDGMSIVATDVCVTVAPGGTKPGSGGRIAGYRYDCDPNDIDNVTVRIYDNTDCTGSVILETETFHDFNCSLPKCTDNYVVFHNEYKNEGDCTVFGDWPLISGLCLPSGDSEYYYITLVNNNITGYPDAKFEYYDDPDCTEQFFTRCLMLSEFNYWCNNTDPVSDRTTAAISSTEAICPDTAAPTTIPTTVPTTMPTTIPTTVPTIIPTSSPITKTPSSDPSVSPTNVPSSNIITTSFKVSNTLHGENGGTNIRNKNHPFMLLCLIISMFCLLC